MVFKDRIEAGQVLAEKLAQYKSKPSTFKEVVDSYKKINTKKVLDEKVVVYGMPRGGVITAFEIVKYLHAPLDLVITRKIGHPASPEYAIAAVAENGHIVIESSEIRNIDKDWFEDEIERQRKEVTRRRELYLQGREMISPKGKVAILVDDGVATGLTLRVGIAELKHHKPAKIVVAVPVVVRSTADILEKEADELVALEIPSDHEFLGAVGAYYEHFPQVEDKEVIEALKSHH